MVAEGRVHRGDLRGLDELEADVLALPLYQVVKQPTAVAGYADWRMCGRLARLLIRGLFRGEAGETLLTPSLGRLGIPSLVLFGLGEPIELTQAQIRAHAEHMATVLEGLKARRIAIAPPELPGKLPPPPSAREDRRERQRLATLPQGARLIADWLELAGGRAGFEELVLLDADGLLVRADHFLAEAAKRGGVRWRGTPH